MELLIFAGTGDGIETPVAIQRATLFGEACSGFDGCSSRTPAPTPRCYVPSPELQLWLVGDRIVYGLAAQERASDSTRWPRAVMFPFLANRFALWGP